MMSGADEVFIYVINIITALRAPSRLEASCSISSGSTITPPLYFSATTEPPVTMLRAEGR